MEPVSGPEGRLLWTLAPTETLKLVPEATETGAFTPTPVTFGSAVVDTGFVIEIVAELLFGFGSRTWTVLTSMLSLHVNVWNDGWLQVSVKLWSRVTVTLTGRITGVLLMAPGVTVQSPSTTAEMSSS